ncbi:MAG: FeeC [Parcubacteria group bacterium Gr01-1014_31]|nr:MAG: FeeC [Parcubacteria group bacterium Gr01-1014_31]
MRTRTKVTVGIAGTIVIAAAALGYAATRPKPVEYETATAVRADLVQEVSVTGRVKPTHAVDLAFERSGRVAVIPVAVGDRVNKGALLAGLNSADLVAQLSEALARVDSAKAQSDQYAAALRNQQARLDEVRRGTRPEEIAVKQAELDTAQQDLANAYKDVVDTLRTASTKADDAVRVKTTALFSGNLSSGYLLLFRACNDPLENDVTFLRASSERSLQAWQTSLTAIGAGTARDVLDLALSDAAKELMLYQQFLDRLNQALVTECSLQDDALDTRRDDVNTARVNIAAQLAAVADLQQDISANQRIVARVEEELKLKQAGSTSSQVAAQEALVAQAEATLAGQLAQIRQMEASAANIRAQLDKAVLRSPFDGVVTKVDLEVGEIIAANVSLVSIISDAGYEIEANVPEADIAKLKIGDAGVATLDAYGNDVTFRTHVAKIDPAETVVEGVPTYVVTVLFDQPDERIRSGMTADLDIRAAERTNVIVVPLRAVFGRNGDKFVRKLRSQTGGNEVVEVTVGVGLRGSDGNIEITTGLSEGDRVLIEVPKP